MLIPKSEAPNFEEILKRPDEGRGPLYAALIAPDTTHKTALSALERIKEGILYPLARNVAGLPQDTPASDIPGNALTAAMGMFRVFKWDREPETTKAILTALLKDERKHS